MNNMKKGGFGKFVCGAAIGAGLGTAIPKPYAK